MVPQGIVNFLEAIEIHENQCDRLLLACRVLYGMVQAVVQQVTVGQSGQGIVQGLVFQIRLLALAVGDVGNGSGHTHGPPLFVAQRLATHQQPTLAIVTRLAAKFRFEQLLGTAFQVTPEPGFRDVAVIGVDQRVPDLQGLGHGFTNSRRTQNFIQPR